MEPDAAPPPTPPLRRTRRWWRRIALGLLAILAVTEVGLRFAGWFILRARAAAVEHELSSTPDAVRLLHVGESTTFGLGVEPAQAYPAVVATLLHDHDPSRQFVSFNRGVPGITTTAILRTFPDKLAVLRPQLVTILASVNDFNPQLTGLDWDGPARLTPIVGLLAELRLVKAVRFALDSRRQEVAVQDGDVVFYRPVLAGHLLDQTPRDDAKIARVTARAEWNLHRMVSLCRAAGVPIALVGYHLAPNYEDTIIARVAAEEGVPYIFTGIPAQERGPELFNADGWHPSALGHRRMAERIAAVVGPLLIGNATPQERGPAAGGD